MAAESTHPDAATLDVERWLLDWLRVPQPALGGRTPEELLNTPDGVEPVSRVLGAIMSCTFQ
ncbi:antitoxin Xre/MbcA/ParS toxin-binding domain-containing protein [Thiomonas sp.]|uniref:antitoxin Xre/MbcA/ParS toxin-binding domain-containing protein n=1 Tax=Thiomonas sp. TaxID=2047785 RepID=UPI00345CBCFD